MKDDLKEKFKKIIKENRLFKPGDKIVVGTSGGPDSVCLLHLLSTFPSFKIITAHLNHNLRSRESRQDEEFVKNLARKLGLKFYSKKLNWKKIKKGNLEEICRNGRYQFFGEVAKKEKTDLVAVAHTADDQIETVLLNLLRGAGLRGLSGMKYATKFKVQSSKFKVVRPLLTIWRKEIENYLAKNRIDFRVDRSNYDLRFTRNRIRHQLIPSLEVENPNFKVMFLEKITKNQKKYEAFQKEVEKFYKKIKLKETKAQIELDLKKFLKLNKNLKNELLRKVFEKLLGNLKEFGSIHLSEVNEILKKSKTGSFKKLPGGLVVYKDYEKVVVSCQSSVISYFKIKKRTLKVPGITKIPEIKAKIETEFVSEIDKSNRFTIFINYDKIKDSLKVRSRRNGDLFYPLGLGGKKKLQDFFVDLKIPRLMRDQIPIVSTNNEIIWIGKYRLDERFKVDKKTREILKIKLQYKFSKSPFAKASEGKGENHAFKLD